MFRTCEATVESDGTVRLDEPVALTGPCLALVTILGSTRVGRVSETAVLSEVALSEGWSGDAEDAAWEHLSDLPEIGDADL